MIGSERGKRMQVNGPRGVNKKFVVDFKAMDNTGLKGRLRDIRGPCSLVGEEMGH